MDGSKSKYKTLLPENSHDDVVEGDTTRQVALKIASEFDLSVRSTDEVIIPILILENNKAQYHVYEGNVWIEFVESERSFSPKPGRKKEVDVTHHHSRSIANIQRENLDAELKSLWESPIDPGIPELDPSDIRDWLSTVDATGSPELVAPLHDDLLECVSHHNNLVVRDAMAAIWTLTKNDPEFINGELRRLIGQVGCRQEITHSTFSLLIETIKTSNLREEQQEVTSVVSELADLLATETNNDIYNGGPEGAAQALSLLSDVFPQALSEEVEKLENSWDVLDARGRQDMVFVFGELLNQGVGSTHAIQAIESALADSDSDVRSTACAAIEKRPELFSISTVKTLAKEDPETEIAKAAQSALEAIQSTEQSGRELPNNTNKGSNKSYQFDTSDGESAKSASSGNAEYTSAHISSLLHSAYYNAKNLSIFAAIEDPDIVPTLLAESERRARTIAAQIDNEEDIEWVVYPKSSDPDATIPITRPTHKIPGPVDLEIPNSITYNELEFGDRIGKGGFAEIRATNVKSTPDTQIAVKRLSDEGTVTKEKINRFIKEAELWAQCADHPHVVSVIDWGHVPRPWIAMEHLTGGDLRDRIHDADGGLPLDESLWIATVLAETLADVHHLGVRHLDLQARNIVFAATPEDVWMFPKIGDWGAAKAQRTQKKGPSVLNPSYAAPEQFESERVLDHRTDIYQFGAVIYELLTGQVPTVNGATGKSISERSLPVPPSELRSELPASVDEIVQTALDPHPSNRYSRAIYLYDALDEIVED